MVLGVDVERNVGGVLEQDLLGAAYGLEALLAIHQRLGGVDLGLDRLVAPVLAVVLRLTHVRRQDVGLGVGVVVDAAEAGDLEVAGAGVGEEGLPFLGV